MLFVAALGLSIVCAALYYWYSQPDGAIRAGKNHLLGELTVNSPEPITPLPLDLNLNRRKVALGKRLFHDPRLSSDNTISCAHCHNLSNGGMDGLPHSIGIRGQEGKVNTPTVFNSGFNFRLFWDGRSASLEDQIHFPMANSREMDSRWDQVIEKLERDAEYQRDFSTVYSDVVRPPLIVDAIATFEWSLITPNGKFDRYLRGDMTVLDREEKAGYALFKNLGCISCHQGMNVGGNMYEKLGLFGNYFENRGNIQDVDYGRYNVTKNEEHRFEFRVPSLRNVALTAPYFHDASASTLEQAVLIMGRYQLGVELSKDEIAKIVKFLNTLTGIYQPDVAQ